MKDFQYITGSHPQYIESLYTDFTKDPNSVDPEMKKFFEGFDFAVSSGSVAGNTSTSLSAANGASTSLSTSPSVDWMKEIMAYRMILGYRNKGHLLATTNPIRKRKDRGANIELAFYGFSEADLDKEFYAGQLIGLGKTSLRNIQQHMVKCYASNVGVEFKYISDQTKVDFLTNAFEKEFHQPLPLNKRKRILP